MSSKDSIYKGLYPIREVKQYYRREFVNQKALYLCLLCDFKTWKYSQHIARHIHLKHIGIKELKCEEANCGKTFKRPESLVQHQKNHLCGFGIDSSKMKDPNNTCGVKNIKKFYFRELDNDYYVFGCKWAGCEFVTNNSGSIRRHVHNQHLCPHAVATNGSSNGNSGDTKRQIIPQPELNFGDNDFNVEQPIVEIIEMDVNPQLMAMKSDDSNDNPFAISAIETEEVEDNLNDKSSTGGLYSLSNYSDLFSKVLIDGQVFLKCKYNDFTTKNQISLVRHIWTHIGQGGGTDETASQETNNSSKRKRSKLHTSDSGQNGSSLKVEIAGTSGLTPSSSIDFTAFPQTINALINGSSSVNYNNKTGVVVDPTAQTHGILALQSLSQQLFTSNANQNIPILPKNFDNIYANNLNLFDESISSIESLREDMNSGNGSKSNGFKRSFGSDRNNSGLYSLKNYEKFYTKVKDNNDPEFTYKCTTCGQSFRSQVSLIRHIWTHTGRTTFECDNSDCREQFSSETDLYKHRKSHTSHPTVTSTPTPIFPAITAINRSVTSVIMNGASDLQSLLTPAKSQMTGSAIRKIMESKPERGLYSLKKYENQYKKVSAGESQGFKFVCNCGQFETKSQATLVRHIWEHQNNQKAVDSLENNESNGFENMSQTSNEFEMSTTESVGRRDSRSMDGEAAEEADEESGDQNDGSVVSKDLSFKNFKDSDNNDVKSGGDAQKSSEMTAEEVYLNSLIVEIEDRGYFCQWPECEFSDEQREPVVLHIKQIHNNLEGNTDTDTPPMQTTGEADGEGEDEDMNGSYESASEHNFDETTEGQANHYRCDYNYCGASFPSFDSLEEHKKMHLEYNSEDNCDESMDEEMNYSGSELLETALKTSKSYSYDGRASAQNAEKLTETSIMSDGSYLFSCKWDACGYQSPVRGNIIRHIRRHTGDKPFVCELNECGRAFAYSSDVKLHQQKEH